MKHPHIYLGVIILLHGVSAALWEVWFWNYAHHGRPEGDWMVSPAIYWMPLFFLIFIWCRVDSSQRMVRLPFGVSVLVTFLFPIGVPYYFFRIYSRRLALIRTGQFLVFAAACVGALWLGHEFVYRYYAVWTNR